LASPKDIPSQPLKTEIMPEKVHSRIDVKEAQIASADASELSHVRSLRKRFVGPRSLTLGLPNKAFHPTLLLALSGAIYFVQDFMLPYSNQRQGQITGTSSRGTHLRPIETPSGNGWRVPATAYTTRTISIRTRIYLAELRSSNSYRTRLN